MTTVKCWISPRATAWCASRIVSERDAVHEVRSGVGGRTNRSGPGPELMTGGTLTGDRVLNAEGDDVDKINEIMVDVPEGRIAYVLEFGSVRGIGGKLFAAPCSRSRWTPTTNASSWTSSRKASRTRRALTETIGHRWLMNNGRRACTRSMVRRPIGNSPQDSSLRTPISSNDDPGHGWPGADVAAPLRVQ